VERSRALLTDLEKGAAGQSTGPLARARRKQLELFELVPVPSIATGNSQEPLPEEVTALLQALSSLDPDDLTPRQALSWLGEWRGRFAALPAGVQDRLLKR
jgi:DNA mismatch repair ATPase MutS